MKTDVFNYLFSREEHLDFLRKQTRLQTFIKEKSVVVDSIYTLDAGFETMVFPADEEGKIKDFGDLQCQRYDTYEEMQKGHKKIVKEWRKENE